MDKRFHALAVMRLKNFSNILFYLGDSRDFLRQLSTDDKNKLSLIYLDAHWHDDLPLKEELLIIKDMRPNSVIIIDDFEVPGDFGYNWDNYGSDRALKLSVFSRMFNDLSLIPYSPRAHSKEESGAKRGCVILAQEGEMTKVLDCMTSIRRA